MDTDKTIGFKFIGKRLSVVTFTRFISNDLSHSFVALQMFKNFL